MSINFNTSQIEAINHNEGPMIVLSGPGSGKTTVITYRIKNLIQKYGALPQEILVISFTKASKEEMKERFIKICNFDKVSFETFHSYFFKIIRKYYNYKTENILEEYQKNDIIKKIIYEIKINFENEEDFLQNIINEISLVKNELINIDLFDSNITNPESFREIFLKYEMFKQNINKIDFDDMLLNCYNLLIKNQNIVEFWKNRYKYILIDEFQDINKIQYEIIKLLVNEKQNIFVVGDDDQSIYGFRGSSPRFLLDFPKDFKNTKISILNINYRSSEQIIKLCNTIIEDNKNRYEKNIKGQGINFKTPILLRCFDTKEEAQKITKKILQIKNEINLEEIAIIYRTNIQARAIIQEFSKQNIEYQIKDKITTIYEHSIVKDIIAYLKLSLNINDNIAFARIVNKPKRYISKVIINNALENCDENNSALKYIYSLTALKTWQLEKINELLFHINILSKKSPYDAIKYILNNIGYYEYLQEYSEFKKVDFQNLVDIANEFLETAKGDFDTISFLEYIENLNNEINSISYKKNRGVVLTTIHSSKGLEFEAVFVISCIDGIIPHKKSKSDFEIEEERRLFYVALTRAKKILYISIIKTKYENNVKPSRFLNKIIKNK